MTELDPTTLRRELLIEQGIESQLNALVKQANKTAAILENHPRMEESQLRNLLNAAIDARSTEVVINFIRYQIARNGSAWGVAPGSFGHSVINDLNTVLPKWHKQALAFVAQQNNAPELTAERSEKAMVRLMQLYLGYLNRAFYYAKKTNDFASLGRVNAITQAMEQGAAKTEEVRHG
ncbi:MAG TPA: hypothetical protein PKK15_02525 [Kouleothrix sp.]|nr:hypothetical protein [Kouleothrix sp.]